MLDKISVIVYHVVVECRFGASVDLTEGAELWWLPKCPKILFYIFNSRFNFNSIFVHNGL